MKTHSNMITAILLALFFAFLSNTANAQCPVISTNLNCPVDVTIDVYDLDPALVCNPIPCFSYALNIPPGGVMPVNCSGGGCLILCDVVVTVTQVGGMPVPISSANMQAAPPCPGPAFPVPAGCSGSGTYNICYDIGGNTFKISQ